MDIFARVTVSYDDVSGFIEKLSEDCDKLIVYQHDTARVHIHFYAVNCRIKTDAIKTRIKKYLHVAEWDKNNWSFKSANDSGCITYMSKGKLDPRYIKGFTQEEIIGYKDKWTERVPETSLPKKSGPTQYDMAMEVYDIVTDKYTRCYGVIHTQEIYRDCFITAISVCRKYKKGFDEYSIRKIVHPAYTKFEHCEQQFVEKAVNKFFS